MARPIIFLAFANNNTDPFLQLTREDDGIYELFQHGNEGGYIIHRDQYTSADELIYFIELFKNQVSIFHFGGHAGKDILSMEDQSIRATGFAGLLGGQKYLRLVFLNGCSTFGMVNDLLRAGVPCVIATDREVGDEASVEFAIRFYQSLVGGNSIGEAFEHAKHALLAKRGISLVKRSAGVMKRNRSDQESPFEWGIYARNESALEWTLGQAKHDVYGLTKQSWPRFSFFVLALVGIFLWVYHHFGSAFTGYLFGGSVLLGGIGMIVRFALNAHQPIKNVFTEVYQNASKKVFKTPVLMLLWGLLAVLAFFVSSLIVHHEEENGAEVHILNAMQEPAKSWHISGNASEYDRYIFFSNPLSTEKKVLIEGFHPVNLHVNPGLREMIHTRNLAIKTTLLLRLNPLDIRNSNKISLTIRSGSQQYHIDSFGSASIALGPVRNPGEDAREYWRKEYTDQGWIPQLRAPCIEKWGDPKFFYGDAGFNPGETVKIIYSMNDRQNEMEVEIENQKINDVLLEKCDS